MQMNLALITDSTDIHVAGIVSAGKGSENPGALRNTAPYWRGALIHYNPLRNSP